MECGQDAYVDLMKRYPMVTDAFLRLKPGYQKVWYSLPATSTISCKSRMNHHNFSVSGVSFQPRANGRCSGD